MERLTWRRDLDGHTDVGLWDGVTVGDAVHRLADYEDTGLEPEEIYRERFLIAARKNPEKLDRLMELIDADADGRLVVLNEPRMPLVWGNDTHDTILCPNCNHDLMGAFPEDEYCEKDMYQCPYCGQPIDSTKAITIEEAEAALKKREEADNEAD